MNMDSYIKAAHQINMEVQGLRTLKSSQSETTRIVLELSQKIHDYDDRITLINSNSDKITTQLKQILTRLDKLEKDIDSILNG